jgi:Flp pilus assembly protein CpaB
MRRGRILIFLLLIVVIGLVVVFFAVRTLLPGPAAAPTVNNVEVFVAGQNIPQGATITEDQLATISLPQDKVSAVEFTADKKGQLVGKVAKFPLDQGTVITSSMVAESTQAVSIAGPQWAALIPSGMTAISVPASRLSLVSYGINDGAHVNLQSCFLFVDVDPSFQTLTPDTTATLTGTGFPQNALPVLSLGVGAGGGPQGRLELEPSVQQPYYLTPSEQQRPRVVCQTILQDVVVMKLGNFPLSTTNTQATQQQQQQQQQGAAPAPDIITLIVSPQDAVTLQYMVYTNAQIMMTLRNPTDQSRLATEAATLQFLLSQYNIPVPAKLPYALQPRIDALAAPVLPNEGAPTTP